MNSSIGDKQYRFLIDAIDEGVVLFDPTSTQIIAANTKFFELIGKECQNGDQGLFYALVAIEDADRFNRILNTIRQKKAWEGILSFKNDSSFPHELNFHATLVDDESRSIIQAIIRPTQAGKIIDRQHMEESIRQRAEELKVLHDLSLNISTIQDQPTLHKNIIAYAARLLNSDGGCLYLCDPEENCVNLSAEYPSHTGNYKTIKFKFGEGAAGWVAQSKKPLNISQPSDVQEPFTLTDTEELYGAMLLAPMVWQGQIKGVMQVFIARGERKFTEPELELLTLYANQAAIAIENARLFEAERSAHEQADLFREVAQVVNESLVLDEVLQRILDQLKRVLTFATCSVLLFREYGKPALVAGSGYIDEKLTSRFASEVLVESPIIRRMAKDLQPVVIPDVRLHPDWIWVKGAEHVRSFMGVPIIAQQKLIGVLMVDSITLDFFKQSDLQKSKTLAQQMAIAIQNARLFDSEKAARERAEALRDAARIISSSLSLSQVLQGVLEQLSRVIIFDTGSIMLLEGEKLKIKAWRGYDYYYEQETVDSISSDYKRENRIIKTLKSKVPYVIRDIREDPSWEMTPISEHIRSWLGVPLVVRDQVIGLLNLDRVTSNGYTSDEVTTVQLFAVHASTAIENARLYEKEEERATELEALRQASISLTSSLELQAVLDAILKSALKLLRDANNGHIFLYSDEDSGRLTFGASLWSDGRYGQPIAIPRPDGLTATVAKSGEILVVNDMQNSDMYKNTPKDWHGAIVGLPLKIGLRVVGVMNISYDTPRQFSEEDLHLLHMLGVQAAIAIENARLFEQAATERRHLGLLFDINKELTATFDVDEILARAISLTSRVLNGVLGQAFLYHPEEELLILHSLCGVTPALLPDTHEKIKLQLGDGLAGWVALNHLPTIIPDVNQDVRWLRVDGLDDNIQSAISAPIMAADNILGVINVLHNDKDAFSTNQLELLQAICQEVGLALSNANSYQEVKRRLTEMTLMQSLAQKFNQRLEVQVILDEVVKQLGEMFGYPLVEIFLTDGDQLKVKAFYGSIDPIKEIAAGVGIVGRAIRVGKAILVPDVSEDDDYIKDYPNTVAELAVPIFRENEVVGAINIETDRLSQLCERDRELLEVLAGQVSIALENALLYERVHEHAQELEITVARRTSELQELYQVSQKIGYILSYDELFHILLSHLRSAIGTEIVAGCYFQNGYRKISVETIRPMAPSALNELRERCESIVTQDSGSDSKIAKIPVEAVLCSDLPHESTQIQALDSVLEAPILSGGKCVGMLIVAGSGVRQESEGQKRLLSTFAHQASMAVERISAILAAEQQRLENLVEHLPVGVLFLDSDQRLLVSNPLGKELLTVLDARMSDNVLIELAGFSIEEIINCRAETVPLEVVQEGFLHRYFEAQARPVGETEQQWVIMLREITQEKENQSRIQMQERLATVGQLAAGIAHDFNNIMAAILVYADLLRSDPNLQQASQDRLLIIQQQVQRAASLIRQILDFSRRSVMEQSSLDVLPFIKELEKMLVRVIPETIHLELKYQQGSYLIHADPTRLQQVFMNLAVNARDAMPEGGTLEFSLKRITYQAGDLSPIPDLPFGNWIVISVKDSGQGIPVEHLPHIFEPFYTTKPIGQGTGLGLAQVYGIIKQHDGYIDVQSRKGMGTTFTIYLRSLDEIDEHPITVETSSLDGVGVSVLIVEDDHATREALKALLEAYNYKTYIAVNGLEALTYLDEQSGSIELIISDVVMPKMGGLELYNAIQARWPNIKMLFVTGHPMDGENQKLLERGSVHWLQKPFSVQEFSQAVQNLLEA
ncbi:MAG: GAF domain-containing protein [Anaerolineales bacterium]|nr:GAF domain-containing protein [Anaerolineales bacterium]